MIQYPNGTTAELGSHDVATTNNRMELQALISALQHIRKEALESQTSIHVLADSKYVIDIATGRNKSKANSDLWTTYHEVAQGLNLQFEWVKGHSGHSLNEQVDAIAVKHRDIAVAAVAHQTAAPSPSVPSPVISQAPASQPVSSIPTQAVGQASLPSSTAIEAVTSPTAYPCYLSYIGTSQSSVQIHMSWAECEKTVSGVSGAKFKKIKSEWEYQQTLTQWGIPLQTQDNPPSPPPGQLDSQPQQSAQSQPQSPIQPQPTPSLRYILVVESLDDVSNEHLSRTATAVTGIVNRAFARAQEKGHQAINFQVNCPDNSPAPGWVSGAIEQCQPQYSISASQSGKPNRDEASSHLDSVLVLVTPDPQSEVARTAISAAAQMQLQAIAYNVSSGKYHNYPAPTPTIAVQREITHSSRD